MLRLYIAMALLTNLAVAEIREAEGAVYDFDAAQRYCRQLGAPWRSLHIKELFALRGQTERFGAGRSYWSSDTADTGISRQGTGSEGELSRRAEYGYTFYLQDGDVTISPVSKRAGVLCTATPYDPDTPVYEGTAQGIIDRDNALLWEALDSRDKTIKRTHEQARLFCEALGSHGRSWRLPTVDELYAIVTYERMQPTVDVGTFGVMMSRYYWSDDAFGDKDAYVVGFKLGSVATSPKDNKSYFRCVSDLDE